MKNTDVYCRGGEPPKAYICKDTKKAPGFPFPVVVLHTYTPEDGDGPSPLAVKREPGAPLNNFGFSHGEKKIPRWTL